MGEAVSAQARLSDDAVSSGLAWQHGMAARSAHAVVALLSGAGLASSAYLGWTVDSDLPDGVGYAGGFTAGWDHLVNQPAYFTVLSALMVCVTSIMLTVRTRWDSQLFQVVRLSGVVCVIITGVVFNLLLRGDGALTGVRLFNDTVLHLLVPVLAPLVWLIFGPHGRLRPLVVGLSMVIPLTWLAVTLGRGPFLDWYPYTILDVPGMGYPGVWTYVVSILGVYLVLALLMWAVDRGITRWARP